MCSQDATSRVIISGVVSLNGTSLAVDCSVNSRNEVTAQQTALLLEPFFSGICPKSEEICLPLIPVEKEPLQM